MSRLGVTVAAFVLALGTTAGAAAAQPGAVLGAEGELFHIEQGTFGELMNRPRSPHAANSVLVLRIERNDRPAERHLLPATLGPDVESAAALLYEEASDTLFVAWEQRTNLIHSQIRLAGFTGGAWGDPIAVSDSRFSFKSDPRLAVTRDSFEGRDAEGEPVTVRRTVLHVVWVEERAEGLAVVYSPLVLLDGAFEGPGPGPIFALSDLVTAADDELLPVPLADLPLPAAVDAGADGHSVVVGFVHPASGRLTALDLVLLSGDVSSLADKARAQMIETGGRYDTRSPGGVRALADATRAQMIETGVRLDPAVLSFVADRMHAFVLEHAPDYDLSDDGELRRFGDIARGQYIETGVRLEERGLRRSALAQPMVLDLRGSEDEPSHQIALDVVAARGLDGADHGDGALVVLSPSGADALIAWEQGGQLRYQESRGEGWSQVRAIPLTTLGRDRALEIVRQRIRNR